MWVSPITQSTPCIGGTLFWPLKERAEIVLLSKLVRVHAYDTSHHRMNIDWACKPFNTAALDHPLGALLIEKHLSSV
jgi:hypothetical protein